MMRRLSTRLLCAGITMLVCSILMFWYSFRQAMKHVRIIGGADAPTFWYLLKSGALMPFLIPGAAGLILIIAGILLRLRKSG